jgi:regulation of enolase protein 1 (concanavalin A-like superfamily)
LGAVHWLNEPARWLDNDGVLSVTADGGTDFWRTTGYGYIRDNGHLYGTEFPGDFDLRVRVRGTYVDQYDQAGAMIRVDERNWIKTGIEFFDGRPRFSTVVTLDYSSWAVADLPQGTDGIVLSVTRRGDAVEIRYALDGGRGELAALAYLPPGRAVMAGAMCAAPEGSGFPVAFDRLLLEPR